MPDTPMKFFATAPKGMAGLLADELTALGAHAVAASSAGARFEGTLAVAYRACLWSRIANRVLLPLAGFKATTPEALYDGVRAMPWEEHLACDGTLAVDCTAVTSPITHTRYAALKVKDAVVDRFRERQGVRPSVDVERPDVRINLHLRRDRARVSLDLSGDSLHRRGYRAVGVAAPLKENLAAAILILAGWPELARGGGALLDPMCGSGTLLIEGAWLAADIAPGLNRSYFGFVGWRGHDPGLWENLLAEARERRDRGLPRLPPVRGYDSDPRAVQATLANLEGAGLRGRVEVEQRNLAEDLAPAMLALQGRAGLMVVNPPYGQRIGEMNALRTLYARLGELLRDPLSGWRAAVFTGNPELAAYIGLTAQRTDTLYNGATECTLFHYGAAGTAGRGVGPGGEMFANRLRKNLRHLGRWARREGIDCYRVYDADLPEYAVAVDLYHGAKRWAHVQEYQAPNTVDAARAQQRLQEALAAIPQVLEIPAQQMFFKVRRPQRGRSQYQKLGAGGEFYEVREGACRLLVNFSDYLDTGLFLDHRITRALIGELAQGRRFLNLFGYTGAATVHAALGGALATTTVDMSKTYLDWARRNLALNGLDERRHALVQADCLDWLAHAAGGKEPRQRYGLIFLDPPTFSTSARMEHAFDVQRDHVALIRSAVKLLDPDGTLLFSNNFRKFKLDHAALNGLHIEDISRATIPKDFERNPAIHRCWKIRNRTPAG